MSQTAICVVLRIYNLIAMKLLEWFSTPNNSGSITKHNFVFTQLDAIGVGISSAAATFLPVLLSRLNASNFQISLVSAMPSLAGLLLAIPFGRMLEKRKDIVPWYGSTRLIYLFGYALSGLTPILFSHHPWQTWVTIILIIWGVIAVPQVILSITFSVVMDKISGRSGRFELMTRRWALLGIINALFIFLGGQCLTLFLFPNNFSFVLILLSAGGLLAFFSSNQIKIPQGFQFPQKIKTIRKKKLENPLSFVLKEKPFISIVLKRIIFLFGVALGSPFFALYYVRTVNANNAWIANFSTIQTVMMVFGYFFWLKVYERSGSRIILITTTLSIALYPILIALTGNAWLILLISAVSGLFQAGLDLVLFDELMKTIPPAYSSTFVAISQSSQYLSALIAPLIGSFFADRFGLGIVLILSGVIKFIGFGLVLFSSGKRTALGGQAR